MTNAYNPGFRFRLSSAYGKRGDPKTGKDKLHAGQDFAAPAGTPIPAAASGTVIYSGLNKGLGNVVIVKNDTGGYSLYAHMLDGDRAELGRRIWQGDTLGLVGSTGKSTGNHLHYSVIDNEAGKSVTATSKDGSIGIPLNDTTTINPAGYDNYDPTPRYLDETRRAAQIMSGAGASTTFGGLPSDPLDSFSDRFGKWGSSPAGITPLAAPDRPASFNNRFGNWGSAPADDFGNPRSPVLRWLQNYRRSEVPDGSSSTSAQGAPTATPALQPNFPSEELALSDRSKNVPGGPRTDTYPRLQSRRVGSAFPGVTPLNPNQPAPPPERAPPLGIFSGKPVSQGLLPPSVWGLSDHSDPSGDNDWFNFLAGIASQNPTQPEPAPQTAGKPEQSLGRRIVGQSQAPALDQGASAAPLAPSGDQNFSGGLLGRFAALAAIDPQNPTQPAPPPLDHQLRGFYRDDPVQPWFVQRQR
jgi:hypothetical protein